MRGPQLGYRCPLEQAFQKVPWFVVTLDFQFPHRPWLTDRIVVKVAAIGRVVAPSNRPSTGCVTLEDQASFLFAQKVDFDFQVGQHVFLPTHTVNLVGGQRPTSVEDFLETLNFVFEQARSVAILTLPIGHRSGPASLR
jgi:hypothetical protein